MGYIAPVVQKNDYNSVMPWTVYAGMKTNDPKEQYTITSEPSKELETK